MNRLQFLKRCGLYLAGLAVAPAAVEAALEERPKRWRVRYRSPQYTYVEPDGRYTCQSWPRQPVKGRTVETFIADEQYTGTGEPQDINIGFKPDWVWVRPEHEELAHRIIAS